MEQVCNVEVVESAFRGIFSTIPDFLRPI